MEHASRDPESSRIRSLAVGGVLVAAIAAVHARVAGHPFVGFDDPLYIGSVRGAPDGAGIVWAFTNDDAFLFHPLTWLSYRLNDVLFGVESAGPWLLTNVALHAASALLLLRALPALGAAFWPSAFVAFLFALHPVQVEAVAWASSRKDVLAGFFFTATLWSYAVWARRGGKARYAAWNGLGVLGLLSKGTLAPLPFVLVLVDYWPLRRAGPRVQPASGPGAAPGPSLARLAAEKLPLLAASAGVLAIGFGWMDAAWNVWGDDPPLIERLAVAPHVALQGLGRLLWPSNLAVFYPSPAQAGLAPSAFAGWPPLRLAVAALVLLALTAGALAAAATRGTRGYALVGWGWFLVLLAPVLGVVPMGLRTLHDRYLYLAMIGVAIVLAFGGAEAVSRVGRSSTRARWAAGVLAALLLGACAVLAARQVAVWRDTDALLDHTIRVTPPNAVAHYAKGIAQARRGDVAEALRSLERALEIHPGHADASTSRGWLLLQQGRPHEALPPLRRAVEARPDWGRALSNLGNALLAADRAREGLARLEEATRVAPDSADAHYWLGAAFAAGGRRDEAAASLHAALALEPDHPWARRALAVLEAGDARP